MSDSNKKDVKPWYKEPWPWLLMLGPAVAMVGCAITITLALNNFSDQAIYDGGVKRGLFVEKTSSTQTSPTTAR